MGCLRNASEPQAGSGPRIGGLGGPHTSHLEQSAWGAGCPRMRASLSSLAHANRGAWGVRLAPPISVMAGHAVERGFRVPGRVFFPVAVDAPAHGERAGVGTDADE